MIFLLDNFDTPTSQSFKFIGHANTRADFPDIDLEVTDEELGYGRSGTVYLGYMKPSDSTTSIPVAVKVSNGNPGIDEEMENEASILLYAQRKGIQTTPRIYYSGVKFDRFINVQQRKVLPEILSRSQ